MNDGSAGTSRWALLATGVAALAAGCGGSNDDNLGASLDSPDSVVQALAFTDVAALLPMSVPGARALSRAAAATPRSSGARSALVAKETVACGSSGSDGTFDLARPVVRDVGSPFTGEMFLVEDIQYTNCFSAVSDDEFVIQTGFTQFGCPVSQSSDDTPCDGSGDGSGSIEYQAKGFGDKTYHETGVRQNADGELVDFDELFMNSVTHTLTPTTGPGVTVEFTTFSGRIRSEGDDSRALQFSGHRGTAAAPRRVASTFDGTTTSLDVSGNFGYTGDGCDVGTYSVATTQPITSAGSGSDRLANGGTVQIMSATSTATLQFAADGSFTVTGSRGDTRTYAGAEAVRSALGGCLPHVLFAP